MDGPAAVSTSTGATRRVRRALHLERGMGQAERRLRKSLRADGAELEPKRRPAEIWRPWLDRPLQSRAEVDAALAECYEQAGAAYICGAGCEAPRGTPHANLEAMTRFARSRA